MKPDISEILKSLDDITPFSTVEGSQNEKNEKQAPNLARSGVQNQNEGKYMGEKEKRSETKYEGVGSVQKLQRDVDARQAEKERNLQIYREYQENKRRAGHLKVEILKGLKAGEDINTLFLKACEAIGLMTSEKLFAGNAEADLKAIYGLGLLENKPLNMELEETKGRLTKLKAALEREKGTDSERRIKAAVEAHEKRVEQLEVLIKHRNIDK